MEIFRDLKGDLLRKLRSLVRVKFSVARESINLWLVLQSCFYNKTSRKIRLRQMQKLSLPCVLFSFSVASIGRCDLLFLRLECSCTIGSRLWFYSYLFLLFPFEDKLEAEMEILETSKPEKDNEESENTLRTYDVGEQEDGKTHSQDYSFSYFPIG